VARKFSPPVCALPILLQTVRVDFDTSDKLGTYTGFDAISVIGTLHLPIGQGFWFEYLVMLCLQHFDSVLLLDLCSG
jgi:hypothetical protein